MKKVCPENQISHFLELFYPTERTRLYDYIKKNQDLKDYLFYIFLRFYNKKI